MPGPFTVRAARIDDAEGIAVVARESWLWAYSPFMPREFIESKSNLERRINQARSFLSSPQATLVAVDAATGRVIGFATEHMAIQLEGYDAEIGGLYVHPDASRKGVGRGLVAEMVRIFLDRGCRTMAIHTLAQNPISCNFYERIGGRRHSESNWYEYPSVWFVWDELDAFRAR